MIFKLQTWMKFKWLLYQTVLHIAVKNENLDIIRLLLTRKDIDINAKNKVFLFI